MAIEIREVVVRASVVKVLGSSKEEMVSRSDLQKFQDKLMQRVLSKVREMIQEERSFR